MKQQALSERSILLSELQHGDMFPVGGSICGGPPTIFCKNDSDNFSAFFANFLSAVNSLEISELKQGLETYLTANNIDCDSDTFQKAYAFSMVMQKFYPEFSRNYSQRRDSYHNNENCLSEQLANGHAACLEVSVLAAQCMEKSGIQASILVGEMLENPDHEFPSEHTFVILKNNDRQYIFDAVNFIRHPNMPWMPSLYNFDGKQEMLEAANNDRCLIESKAIWGSNTRFFGYGDHNNILTSELVFLDQDKPKYALKPV